MRDTIRKTAVYAAVFAVTALLLTAISVLPALIPQDMIRANMRSSADKMCENEVFFELSEGVPASMIDRYADSITLNIACCFGTGDPLASVMEASYYRDGLKNENENLLASIDTDAEKNQEYLRYWHGSASLARIAHVFIDINAMYLINAALIIILNGALLFILIKNRLYAGAIGTVAALAAAGIWYVPFTLQSAWVFLLAPAFSLITVKLTLDGKTRRLGAVFMIAGIITNWLDFLTCETFVLVMPLVLMIYVKRSRETVPPKSEAVNAAKLCALWLVGYAGMWLLKWLLAAIVLGRDVTPDITGHISERLVGELSENDSPYPLLMLYSLLRNLGCLFPLCYGGIGIIATIFIFLAALFVCYVFRRDGIKASDLLIYTAAGAIPFIRFLVLLEHSYMHFFFVYRALAGSILALCMIIWEIVRPGRTKNAASERKRA